MNAEQTPPKKYYLHLFNIKGACNCTLTYTILFHVNQANAPKDGSITLIFSGKYKSFTFFYV